MPCEELFWVNFLEVFPRVIGFALGVTPIAAVIFAMYVRMDRENRQYTLRLREETRQRQEEFDVARRSRAS